jgi:hypothetical protein
MEKLLSHIKNYASLSQEAVQALYDSFEEVVLSKNEHLLTSGKVCRHLYFLEEGAIRGYYNLDGKEITHWFGFAKDFVTSFHSFITQEPAVEIYNCLKAVFYGLFQKIT